MPTCQTRLGKSGEKGDCNVSQQPGAISLIMQRFKYPYTMFLFTFSDLKTIVFPETVFAVFTSHSSSLLLSGDLRSPSATLSRLPLVILWLWINLLPFAIDNQRQPLAIEEDRKNKPWRPLPSGFITRKAARRTMLTTYSIAFLISIYLGTIQQCITLMALGFVYNDLGGADRSCVIRNLVNAAGFTCFASGATVIASYPSSWTHVSSEWFALIFMTIFSTVQAQDMPDQQGDLARGRKTLPLVIGDRNARWTICIGVLFWSFVAPAFWELGFRGYALPVILGSILSTRVLLKTSTTEDKRTFLIWNIWMVTLYMLPCIERPAS